jgi:glutaredoxin
VSVELCRIAPTTASWRLWPENQSLCAQGFNAGEPKTTTLMTSETKQTVNVYTLPVCPNCSVLKQSLMEHGISFEEHDLDSPQSRTTLLMKGVFTTVAPVLQVKDTFLTFDDLFHNDELNIDLILSLLRC